MLEFLLNLAFVSIILNKNLGIKNDFHRYFRRAFGSVLIHVSPIDIFLKMFSSEFFYQSFQGALKQTE